MTTSQRNQVQRLAASGFGVRDIVALTGHDWDEVSMVVCGPAYLRSIAQRLLARRPSWWRDGEERWQHVVRMNFADVL